MLDRVAVIYTEVFFEELHADACRGHGDLLQANATYRKLRTEVRRARQWFRRLGSF
jgi:hypothetical protein